MSWPTEDDLASLELVPLPALVLRILERERAPARLVAHLTLVHDCALRVIDAVRAAWPTVEFDTTLVVFGAASHDVGKARVPRELSEPGTLHEAAGVELLSEHEIDPVRARFARSHGLEPTDTSLQLEDLLVQVSDTLWKGKRAEDLERVLLTHLVAQTGLARWAVFTTWDELADTLTADAPERLDWQARFDVSLLRR